MTTPPTAAATGSPPPPLLHCRDADTAAPLVVTVDIRRRRMALLTSVTVVKLVMFMAALTRGHELMTFRASDYTSTELTTLVNKYNSYSGLIVTLMGKPLESLITLVVPVFILRIMTRSAIGTGSRWHVQLATKLMAAALAYLLANGFNAVNVQQRTLYTTSTILPQDLASSASGGLSGASDGTQIVAETIANNSVANTVLRNLVLPNVPQAATQCLAMDGERTTNDFLEYGVSSRAWMGRALPKALAVQKLQVNSSTGNRTDVAALPMNASQAGNLFMQAMLLMDHYLPQGNDRVWFDRANKSDFASPLAVHAGILPPTAQRASETAQREWLVREAPVYAGLQVAAMPNTSRSHVELEFGRVQLTPHISVETVTIEVEVNQSLLGTPVGKSNKTTRYQTISQRENCGPWPGVCLVEKPVYADRSAYFDPPVQTDAFALCVDANGSEVLRPAWVWVKQSAGFILPCKNASANSMLLVTVSKRLVADALFQNKSANASDVYDNDRMAVVQNPRKFIRYTVARVAWELVNLSAAFNASCGVDTPDQCKGLHLPLESSSFLANSSTPQQQQLVVGARALPLNLLARVSLTDVLIAQNKDQRPATLVRVHEPRRPRTESSLYSTLAGDVLLPHNVLGETRWDPHDQRFATQCSAPVERRLHHVLRNHLYMEDGLQTTYTAALLFLFQNGVATDVLSEEKRGGASMLAFVGNTEVMALWLSTPTQNAWLTVAGAVVLLLGFVGVVVWPLLARCTATGGSGGNGPLVSIDTPLQVARVMLNDTAFPPVLLRRSVVDKNEASELPARALDEFVVTELALRHEAPPAAQEEKDKETHDVAVARSA